MGELCVSNQLWPVGLFIWGGVFVTPNLFIMFQSGALRTIQLDVKTIWNKCLEMLNPFILVCFIITVTLSNAYFSILSMMGSCVSLLKSWPFGRKCCSTHIRANEYINTYRLSWVSYRLNYTKIKIIDISLYQIYLPKLHENILKYYRLNLFKEIAIIFNLELQTTPESPANVSHGFLV